jgi:hypothetical protein
VQPCSVTEHEEHKCPPAAAAAARLTGLPPKYFPVPIALMDGIIGIFDFLAKIFPALEVSQQRLMLLPVTVQQLAQSALQLCYLCLQGKACSSRAGARC